MSSAFDDQAEVVNPGEIDGGDNVLRSSGNDSERTGTRGPSVRPAQCLGQTDVVTDEKGFRSPFRTAAHSSFEACLHMRLASDAPGPTLQSPADSIRAIVLASASRDRLVARAVFETPTA